MAIQIIFYNIIIPTTKLSKCQGLEDIDGAISYFKNQNRNVWHDNNLLTIGGIMSPGDVEKEVLALEKLGLNAISEINGEKNWDDLCVVSFIDGPTLPCTWLETYNNCRELSYAWMKGKKIGIIVKPNITKTENRKYRFLDLIFNRHK